MANRRMFSLKIVDTDAFLDMGAGARLLYYDLSMRADDDGFISNPKKIQRMTGASDDDMRILIAKQFIIPFDTGVCVVKHWRIHNYIQNDRKQDTMYQEEKALLSETDDGVYKMDTKCVQDVSIGKDRLGEDRLGKDRLGKDRLGKDRLGRNDEKMSFFIANKEKLIEKLSDDQNKDYVRNEVDKFIDYWTEPSNTGKQRWQLEKTFDVERRIKRWFRNKVEWSTNKKQVQFFDLTNV